MWESSFGEMRTDDPFVPKEDKLDRSATQIGEGFECAFNRRTKGVVAPHYIENQLHRKRSAKT